MTVTRSSATAKCLVLPPTVTPSEYTAGCKGRGHTITSMFSPLGASGCLPISLS